MESNSREQFKPPCPDCGSEGAPHALTMKSQERIITYVCHACEKTWAVTDPSPSHSAFSDSPRTDLYRIA
jgi:transposase-like protein